VRGGRRGRGGVLFDSGAVFVVGGNFLVVKEKPGEGVVECRSYDKY